MQLAGVTDHEIGLREERERKIKEQGRTVVKLAWMRPETGPAPPEVGARGGRGEGG